MESVLGRQPAVTVEEGVARYANWLEHTPEAIPAWLRAESEAATA
ncbi:hypothetical protein [Streptantibioticus cattleyicolor]|nr:hypothetical protein [Streptantibioticus cattleyicolor]